MNSVKYGLLTLALGFGLQASAQGSSAAPFTAIQPSDYDYFSAILHEAGGESYPAQVDESFSVDPFPGLLHVRLAVVNSSDPNSINVKDLVLKINGTIYFAPLHLISMEEDEFKFSRYFPPGDWRSPAGIFMIVRGTGVNPESGVIEPVSVRLQLTGPYGEPLPALGVDPFFP